MTAPDPRAGEHHPDCYQNMGVPDDMPAGICDCRVLRMLDAASPPAVAASTGTSEDVEALAVILADWLDVRSDDTPRDTARHILTSDWLAAREAAARAEGAAKALTDAADDWDDTDVFPGEEPDWLRDRAARIAGKSR